MNCPHEDKHPTFLITVKNNQEDAYALTDRVLAVYVESDDYLDGHYTDYDALITNAYFLMPHERSKIGLYITQHRVPVSRQLPQELMKLASTVYALIDSHGGPDAVLKEIRGVCNGITSV